MDQGPIELLLIEFPGNEFRGGIIPELKRLVDDGTIAVIDVLLVRKDADGTVTWFEASDLEDAALLAELVTEPSSLLGAEDADEVAEALEPGSSVGMLLFEHLWAGPLSTAIRGSGGRLIDWIRIPPSAIEEVQDVLRKEL